MVINERQIEVIGKRGFYSILKLIKDSDRVIFSDMISVIGSGTTLNRREELLNLKLVYEERQKIGRRTYTFYKLTSKGEKILSLLEEVIKTLEKESKD